MKNQSNWETRMKTRRIYSGRLRMRWWWTDHHYFISDKWHEIIPMSHQIQRILRSLVNWCVGRKTEKTHWFQKQIQWIVLVGTGLNKQTKENRTNENAARQAILDVIFVNRKTALNKTINEIEIKVEQNEEKTPFDVNEWNNFRQILIHLRFICCAFASPEKEVHKI